MATASSILLRLIQIPAQWFDVLLGNGDGTFSAAVSYGPASGVSSRWFWNVKIADMNHDGILDVLSQGTSGIGLKIYTGNGDGTFKAPGTTLLPGRDVKNLTVADINGDGINDISAVILNYEMPSILLGNADGTFKLQYDGTTSDSTFRPYETIFADVNGDGAPDLLTDSAYSGTVGALPAEGGRLKVFLANAVGSTVMARPDILTRQSALAQLKSCDDTLARIQTTLGNIGASVQRLSAASSVTATTRENYDGAYSRITDADIATESANLVRQTILQQSSSMVLAQANLQSRLVLDLLRA